LHAFDPYIRWRAKTWRFTGEDPSMEAINPRQFTLDVVQGSRVYALFYKTNVFPRDGKELVIPRDWAEYVDVFSEKEAERLPPRGGVEHAIELEGGNTRYGRIYNLSKKEMKV